MSSSSSMSMSSGEVPRGLRSERLYSEYSNLKTDDIYKAIAGGCRQVILVTRNHFDLGSRCTTRDLRARH
jgi:hypothetical protein